MRQLLTIFLFLPYLLQAKNIYVSSSGGNDSNNGLTTVAAYKSITKINAIFSSLSPGDSVLFKRGDTFLGSLVLSRSGLSGNPIIIGAYGTGAKPNLSGLVTLHTWTSLGSNLYDCTPDSTLKANCSVVTFNGYPREVGRYPNTNSYLLYSSATSTTVNTSLTGSPSYVGSEIVMKYVTYALSKKTITAQSGGALTVTTGQGIDNGSANQNPSSGSNRGYFLQRFQNSLDANGEWYYNPTTHKMRIYSTVNPSTLTIKASFKDTVINCNSRTYITFDNLQIEGAGIYAIESYNGSNITVQNCDLINNTRAIYMWNATKPTIQNNYIHNSFNNAILIGGNSGTPSSQVNILSNYVDSSGMLTGMASFNSDANMKAIVSRTGAGTIGTYNNIIGNTVKHSGHMGIQFQGSNVLVRRNWVDSFCERLQDGGGFYTFVFNTAVVPAGYYNRVIDSNMVSNAVGTGVWGIGSDQNVDVAGIYMDDQTPNVVIKNNTVWNVPGNGVQMNTPTNISVTDNTFYNCLYAFNLNKRVFGTVSGNSASRNIIYQKASTQYNFYSVNDALSPQTETQWLQGMIIMDSNWVSNLKTSGYRSLTNSGGLGDYNQTAWKGTYLHDVHAVAPPITVTTSNTMIVTNPSDTIKNVPFVGSRWRSPKNIAYDNYIPLAPWSGAVLIANGTANIPPVAKASADETLTLPVNNTAITAVGSSDPDGSISSYHWDQISGPNSASLPTPNAISTGVNGMIAGIYKFKLTVTDNSSSTNTDTVQITVNAAVNLLPVADAGSDFQVTLPTSMSNLTGSATDADGTISSYAWSQLPGGPNTATMGTANAASTTIINLAQGVYDFVLTVTDNSGGQDKDTIEVIVNAAANMTPLVSAGANDEITLPVSTYNLNGSASDPDGTISLIAWTKESGPAGGTISNSAILNPTLSALQQGVYLYKLTVTDNHKPTAGTASSLVQITVNQAVNILPVASAGIDRSFDPPRDSITLFGGGIDPDGTIASYQWTKILGGSAAILNPSSATTIIDSLVTGTYQFELSVTDDRGGVAKDTMTLIVSDQPANIPPVAHSPHPAIRITLPVDSALLVGSGSDEDGEIKGYEWTSNGGVIESPNAATTMIRFTQPGTYTVTLTVIDDRNATAMDYTTIVVSPAPTKHILLGIKVKD